MDKLKAKYMISQISPKLLINFLMNIRKNKIFTKNIMVEKMSQQGELGIRDVVLLSELISILSSFGVLNFNNSNFSLTSEGSDFKQILLKKESLFFELYHVMNYYAFDMNSCSADFLPFKSYQVLCDLIYHQKNNISSKKMSDMVDSYMKETFHVEGSFSEVCTTRGVAWLKYLSPSLLDENNCYITREPDFIEPVLLNIDHYYNIRGIRYMDPLFIDKKVKCDLAMASLIGASYVEDAIGMISNLYPGYLELKYNISGPYIVLKKKITVSCFR